MSKYIDPETRQKYKDMACKVIQESDEIEMDTDFGLTDGIPTKSGYKTYECGHLTSVFKVIKYKKQWKECTAGEALDAHMSGKKIQIKNLSTHNWTDDERILLSLWHWAKPENKYRKEA